MRPNGVADLGEPEREGEIARAQDGIIGRQPDHEVREDDAVPVAVGSEGGKADELTRVGAGDEHIAGRDAVLIGEGVVE